jgi:hypothetical protein
VAARGARAAGDTSDRVSSERRRVLAHVRHFVSETNGMQLCLSDEMEAKRGPWPASLSFG